LRRDEQVTCSPASPEKKSVVSEKNSVPQEKDVPLLKKIERVQRQKNRIIEIPIQFEFEFKNSNSNVI
jgi:hypothetical protein